MKILMIIAQENFRDEEFLTPFNYFLANGVDVDTASTIKGICKGSFGCEADADLSFEDVDTEKYSGIVLVGGSGSKDLDEDIDLERLIIEFKESNKILAAICRAPVILAKSGVIDGMKATVYGDSENLEDFKNHNIHFVKEDVVLDGKLITANGPEAAEEFAECIITLIKH